MPVDVVPGIPGMVGCWHATGTPITWGDDVLSVMTGTLSEDELVRRMQTADALVIMKVGRNLPRIRRALQRCGRTEAAWLVEHARLVALSRHDVELDWAALEAALPGLRSRVIILDMPELEIASHVIQQRVRNGQPIRHMVPRVVEAYIQKHSLYRA